MRRQFNYVILAGAMGLQASAAIGQATANAVLGAKDAFGFKTGDDSVGIYDETSVRGFSLEAAGNYRIEGSYFVKNSGVSAFFLESTTVRIGYNTLGTILPGPSGVVDYKLRDPRRGESSTLTAGLDVFEQPFMELHFKHRSANDGASISAGVSRVFNVRDFQGGSGGESLLLAGTARVTAGPVVSRIFGGEYHYRRPLQSRIVPTSDRLPEKIERGVNLGQDWSFEVGQRRIAGALIDGSIGSGAGVGGTLVFSQEDPTRGYTQIFRTIGPSNAASAMIIAIPHQRSTAWSAELRTHVERTTGDLSHRFDVTARGRRQRARFGGSEVVNLGLVQLGDRPEAVPEPDLSGAGANTHDSVKQWGISGTYRASYRDRLRINAGLMTTHYRKSVRSSVGITETRTSPLLYNFGAALQLSARTEIYASDSLGLEEAGVAPSTASNRNEVLSAIEVKQRELGIRWTPSERWTAVVAGFDTRKPYVGIDPSSGKYTVLGDVRHRGVEASIAGRPAPGLSLLFGGVFIDARISGAQVNSGGVGSRPVNVPRFRGIASVDYALAELKGLSVDAGLTLISARPASSRPSADGHQLEVGSVANLNAGLRYRLPIKRDIVVRAQVQNLFDAYAWDVNSSETLAYTAPRRFRLVLTANI